MALRRVCCKSLELVLHGAEGAAALRPTSRWYSAMPAARSRVSQPAVTSARLLNPQVVTSIRAYSTRSRGHGQEKHKDLYAILQVTPNATQQQIKDAYYKLSMKYHPDRNKGSPQAHDKFTELTEAYSILGQYDLRKKYDKGLLHQYPRQPHHTQKYEPDTAASTVKGSKVKFDFDEFYRAHYGEALRREQAARRERREAMEREKLYSISNHWQQALIITATVSVLLVGWYGYRWRRSRTQFPHDQSL